MPNIFFQGGEAKNFSGRAKSPCAHLSYGAVMGHGGHLVNQPRLLANVIRTHD